MPLVPYKVPQFRRPRDRGLDGFIGHFNGINEGRKTDLIKDEDLQEAYNVDITNNGAAQRRVPVVQVIDFYEELTTYYPVEVLGGAYLSQYSGQKLIVFALPDATAANGILYTYNFDAMVALAGTWGTNYRYDMQVFNNKIYITDATGKPIEYDGINPPARLVGATVPNANYIEEFHNYIILAGDPAAPNTIYISDIGDESQYNNTFLAGSDEQVVTGIKKWNKRLFIMKESSIYELTGTSLSNFSVDLLTNDYGMIFPFAMSGDDSGLYFVSSGFQFVLYNGQFTVISQDIDTTNDYSSFNAVQTCKNKVLFIPNLANEIYVYHKDRQGLTKYDLKRSGETDDYNFGYMFNMIEATYQSDLGVYFLLTTKGINKIEFIVPSLQSLPSNNVFGNYFKESTTETFDNALQKICGADSRYTTYLDPGIVTISKTSPATIEAYYSRDNGNKFTVSGTGITGTDCRGLVQLYRQTGATAWDWGRYMFLTTAECYYSADYGATWASVRTSANMNVIKTAWDDVNDKLYIVISDDEKIYTSIDYGANWVDAGVLNAGSEIADIVSISAGTFVAVAGKKWYISTDYGLTWTLTSTTIFADDLKYLAYDGTYVVAIDDGATDPRIYRSTDSGVTWALYGTVGTGLAVTNIYGYEGTFLTTMSTRGLYYSKDGLATFTKSNLITITGSNSIVNDVSYCNSMVAAAFQTDTTIADSIGKLLYQSTNKDVIRDPDYGYKFFYDIAAHIKTNLVLSDDKIERKLQKVYVDGLLEAGTIEVFDRADASALATKAITGSNMNKLTRVKVNTRDGYKIKIGVDDGNSNFVITKLGVKYIEKNKIRTV